MKGKSVTKWVATLVLFLGTSVSFSMDDPWYFAVNDIRACWKITKGEGVVVTLVDSQVNFNSILQGKEHKLIESATGTFSNTRSNKYNVHGTAMASLIAGERAEISINGKIVPVAGIAPNSKIASVDMSELPYITAINKGLRTAFNIRRTLADKDAEVSGFYRKEQRLVVMCVASGDWYDENKAYDWEAIKDSISGDERVLIVAGVGNDWQEACQKHRKCFLPGMLGIDSVISVGATQEYGPKQKPAIYRNSNYGKGVDILAPGTNIGFLTHTGDFAISSGTSEATAITAGAVTLLTSCNPFVKAFELRRSILKNADCYPHLSDKSDNGCVLNIWKAVQAFCPQKVTKKSYDNVDDTQGGSDEF